MKHFFLFILFCFCSFFIFNACNTGVNKEIAGDFGKNGADIKDTVSINWRGSYENQDEISNPNILDVYYNTKNGCSYIYDRKE